MRETETPKAARRWIAERNGRPSAHASAAHPRILWVCPPRSIPTGQCLKALSQSEQGMNRILFMGGSSLLNCYVVPNCTRISRFIFRQPFLGRLHVSRTAQPSTRRFRASASLRLIGQNELRIFVLLTNACGRLTLWNLACQAKIKRGETPTETKHALAALLGAGGHINEKRLDYEIIVELAENGLAVRTGSGDRDESPFPFGAF